MLKKPGEWFMARVSPNTAANTISTVVMTGLLAYGVYRGINRANRPIEIEPPSPRLPTHGSNRSVGNG